MAEEIERKFLIVGKTWRSPTAPEVLCQGYLSDDPERVVRVRTIGDRAWLTIKGRVRGIGRAEYEYEIPVGEAREMLATLCKCPLLEKRRSRIPHAGLVWEVDEFLGENAGLVVAEVELTSADQSLVLPAWIGREVTGEPRYYNSNLLRNPYSRWGETV